MLTAAIEAEIEVHLAGRAAVVDGYGRQQVARNGQRPGRTMQATMGDVRCGRRAGEGLSDDEATALLGP